MSCEKRPGRRLQRSVVLRGAACLIVSVLSASSAVASALPEGRAYELVTPPDTIGTAILAPQANVLPAGLPQTWNPVAVDGGSVLWATRTSWLGQNGTGLNDVYRAERENDGWRSSLLSPPATQVGISAPVTVWATPDLRTTLWQVYGSTLDPTDHDPVEGSVGQSLADLYSRDANGVFARISKGSLAPPITIESIALTGVSLDAQKVVFQDDRQLEPETGGSGGVYQRVGNKTTVVSLDEHGVPVTGQGLGVADDGNIVAFSRGTQALYVRDVAQGQTSLVADVAPVSGSLAFESLSSDGRKVVFATASALDPSDLDTSVDLYEYDRATGAVARISTADGVTGPGAGNSDGCTPFSAAGNACDVAPVAVSRDGSKVYFVSPERLDGVAGADGQPNLYLRAGGHVRFVSTLDPSDPLFGMRSTERHLRFTPDGSKLIFESRAAITGYDSAGHTEIYVHDPAQGTITCVSCRPSGAPPRGDASLSGGAENEQAIKAPLLPLNSDQSGGRIFFQTTDSIVPADANGVYDVYQYTVASKQVALISTGRSDHESFYFGNGLDGRDVFFFTSESLVPQDRNGTTPKIYDARIGGGFAPPPIPPPACSGEQCRSTGPGAPTPAVVASQNVGGAPTENGSAVVRLKVGKVRAVVGTKATLAVSVSGPGRLQITSSGLAGVRMAVRRATTYHVGVRLTRAASRQLARHKRLTVTARVRFTPARGPAKTNSVHLTFKKRGR